MSRRSGGGVRSEHSVLGPIYREGELKRKCPGLLKILRLQESGKTEKRTSIKKEVPAPLRGGTERHVDVGVLAGKRRSGRQGGTENKIQI